MAKQSRKKAPQGKPSESPSPSKPAKAPVKSRPWLQQLGIILGFFVLIALYFSPIFEGKTLRQGDIQSFAGMSYEARQYHEATGDQAFWTNSMFGGMPTFHAGLQYPGNLAQGVIQIWRKVFPGPTAFILLMFVGFFFLLKSLKVDNWLSALGAVAFSFSSYFFVILEAGHTSKAIAIGLMPLVLAGVLYAFRGRLLLGAVLTAVSLSLQIAANHYQITYYLAITLLVLGVALFVDALLKKTLPDFAKSAGVLVIAALLALGPNMSQILTTSEYVSSTIRGKSELTPTDGAPVSSGLDKDYALQWSYGKMESFTLLIPNFLGGASGTEVSRTSSTYEELRRLYGDQANSIAQQLPTYWGDQPFTSGPVYVGAIICFLFVLGLILVEGPLMWGLLAATILSLMLAWGRNLEWFTDIFFYAFPMYNKFRAVAMILVIAEFTMPLLAVLGLAKAVNYVKEGIPENKVLNAIKIAAGVTGGFALLFLVLGSAFLDFSGPIDAQFQQNPELLNLLMDQRQSMMQGDALRAVLLILASAGLLWFYVKGKVKKSLLIGALIALTLGDMWSVNKRYLNNDNFGRNEAYATPTPPPASKFILQDKDPNYRVLNFYGGNISKTFNSASSAFYHKNVGGYHAAKLRRYQDLIERNIRPEMNRVIQTIQKTPTDSAIQVVLASSSTLNMLNTRYLILSEEQQPVRNRFALGNAWFVDAVQMVDNADQEVAAIQNFDPARTAVVDQRYADRLQGFTAQADPSARISLTEYSPNKLTYSYNASGEQVAVFSEIYYNDTKGWNAYIDGTYTPHFRCDYVLRGLRVPAGAHTIEFKMEPKSYFVGEMIAWGASVLLILLVLGMGFWEFRRSQEKKAHELS